MGGLISAGGGGLTRSEPATVSLQGNHDLWCNAISMSCFSRCVALSRRTETATTTKNTTGIRLTKTYRAVQFKLSADRVTFTLILYS